MQLHEVHLVGLTWFADEGRIVPEKTVLRCGLSNSGAGLGFSFTIANERLDASGPDGVRLALAEFLEGARKERNKNSKR